MKKILKKKNMKRAIVNLYALFGDSDCCNLK